MWKTLAGIVVILQRIVETRPRLILVLTALLSAFFIACLPSLRIENVPGKLDIPIDDPIRVQLKAFEEEFGAGEALIVGVDAGRELDAGAFEVVRSLTEEIAALEGVDRVLSATNAVELDWVPSILFHVLRPRLTYPKRAIADVAVLDSVRRSLEEHPLYADNLISSDGRKLALVVVLKRRIGEQVGGLESIRATLGAIRSRCDKHTESGYRFHYAGTPILATGLQDVLVNDLGLFVPISVLSFLAVMLIMFRAWRPVLIGTSVALLSVIWTLGIVAVSGTPLSMGLTILVPLILAISLAYAVHFLAYYFRRDHGARDRREIIAGMMEHLAAPSVMCGFTTMVGFLSLGTSRLPGIREVGVFAALGVFACTLLINLYLPALLTVVVRPVRQERKGADIVERFVARMAALATRRSAILSAGVICIVVVASGGLVKFRTETNHLKYIPEDSSVRQDFAFIDSSFGGILPIEFRVPVRRAETSSALTRILSFETALRQEIGVGSVVSAVDLVELADRRRPFGRVPTKPVLDIKQGVIPDRLWRILDKAAVGGHLVRLDDSLVTLRISARVHLDGSAGLAELLSRVRSLTEEHLGAFDVRTTGLVPFFVRVDQYVVGTQIGSFLVALTVTALLLTLLGGSRRVAAVTILVNLAPIVLVLGAMGWLGIPLDITTVMIAGIAIGIVVDDTVHIIYRYRREVASGATERTRIATTIQDVGVPVTMTSVILAIGFFSLIPARFTPTAYFGVLSGVTVLAAAVADILLLPALLNILGDRRQV